MKLKENRPSPLPVLNGISIASVELDQEGNLEVTFDLPVKQETTHYETSLKASRTLDVYAYPEIQDLVKQLFQAVRKRILAEPDETMATVDCDHCRESTCCREYNVLLTDEDIDRLRGDEPRAAFIEKNATAAVDWSGDYKYQLRCDEDEDEEKCIFLNRDDQGRMRCGVYARRPQICRSFDMAVCEDFTSMDEED